MNLGLKDLHHSKVIFVNMQKLGLLTKHIQLKQVIEAGRICIAGHE